MWKVAPITEQFQHFGADLKETLWGEVYGKAQVTWQEFLEAESARRRDRHVGCGRYAQPEGRRGWRNGFYFRDFVSWFGTLRLQIARPQEQAFLPGALERFQRWAAVILLIRERRFCAAFRPARWDAGWRFSPARP